MEICIYTQLSLAPTQVKKLIPNADIMPPVQRGDIVRNIRDKTNVVVIIDGTFHQHLAVSPAEIMDALRVGIAVYGSSSMGALRAAELEPYGMIGHGKIFEHIRSESVFADDLLGQSFVAESLAVKNIANTHMDFYCNMHRLVERRSITKNAADRLLNIHRTQDFANRTYATFRAALEASGMTEPRLLHAAEQAYLRMGSQKARDAISLLRRVRHDMERVRRMNAKLRCPSFSSRGHGQGKAS